MNSWIINGLVSFATAATFIVVVVLSRRARLPAAISPVLVTALVVGVTLVATHVPVSRYQVLSAPLRWLLGPAIVALGATLHANRPALRRAGAPLLAAVVVGTTAGVGSALVLARVLGLGPLLTAATLTRTVSTPFAVLAQTRVGGPVSLAAGVAVVTGVIGAMALLPLLNLLGLNGSATTGIAVGVTAHIVGADAVGRRDATAGGFAAVALIGAGVLVSIVVPLVWRVLLG